MGEVSVTASGGQSKSELGRGGNWRGQGERPKEEPKKVKSRDGGKK